uniref:Nicastrin n=1 Tax=Mola mola TaxID=94237 RepID=A0A3Q3X819_MOLML
MGFFVLLASVICNSVEKKIYVNLNNTVPCVRLLNATHQIGCQSSLSGNVGVVHVLESEENLEWVLSSGPHPPYVVILDSPLFTRSVMMKLKNGSRRVAGIAVVAPNANPPEGFSPHTTCPNENTGVYSEDYDPIFAHCNITVWNPLGNGLSYEEFDFPIFSLKDDNETQVIRQCYLDHNRAANGTAPQYPLCAIELFSHMSAVTDTATCMRRNDINFSISPEIVCDPLGDYNVWASTRPLNNTAKGHKMWESVVIAAARLDSRSFFFDIAPGAESGVSGFITLLAAAHALRNATQQAPPNRTILYTLFQGETFDYIGSSRMVYDMQNNQFAVDLNNVHSFLEIGQVGLRSDSKLWLHSDQLSRKNTSVNDEKLIENLQSAAGRVGISVGEVGFSQPLPPSSFQRFLRAKPIPGVVIEDHQSAFTNRFYASMYDNAEYLNVSYPSNLTLEEQLEWVTDTAQALTEVATIVAQALYKQAGGQDVEARGITADPKMVARMLYSFLIRSNNSWFQQLHSSEPTLLVQYLLANLTGSTVNREGFCTRSTVRLSKALSPAFELRDYTSKEYSTWTESRWKPFKGRIFLLSLFSKADMLFSSGREPTNATY